MRWRAYYHAMCKQYNTQLVCKQYKTQIMGDFEKQCENLQICDFKGLLHP